MQKVYLLLRSNRQTGPYSLEELLQLNLKPFDLVWVEGRSAAWQYPFEIPALKPYVPETPQAGARFQPIATAAMEEEVQAPDFNSVPQPQNPAPQKTETPKRVFVSIPKTYTTAREQKAYASDNEQKLYTEQGSFTQHRAYMPPTEEPSPQRSESAKTVNLSYVKPSQQPLGEDAVSTNYSRSLHDVEEDYTKWVYNKKTKKKPSVNPKDLALAVLILAVIGGGYYVMSRPSVTNSVLPANKAAAQTTQPVAEKLPDETEPKEILSPDQRMTTASNNSNSSNETKQTKNIKTKNPVTVSKTQTNSSVPQVQNSMPVEKTTPNIHSDDNGITSKEPEAKPQPKETTTPEKKKKFGEVLKDIFSKKEKKEEARETPKNEAPVSEDPKPATNRQAARRDENNKGDEGGAANTEVNTANLMEQVDLTSNAPDNWMMGVKNLKITLRNRSNFTIQAASVTVSYYDENNQLLDKKLIYFSNVAPKAKSIVNAPDHKFADHVDYKLTTISAKEDRYARN